jgi:hypothetical protein
MKPIRPSKRFAFVAIAFMLVGTALAQQRMSDHDVEKTMGNLKDDAKKFCKTFDSALDKSTIRKTSEEKDAKALSKRFESETSALLESFKSTKKADALPEVLNTADQLQKTAVTARHRRPSELRLAARAR